MIKSFTIQNFRCFETFSIKPFERVNLIVGKNNVGKTALLEALWLHFGYFNPGLPLSIDSFRGLEKFKSNELLWDLFHDFDPMKTVKLTSEDETGRSRTLSISVREKHRSTVRLNKPRQKKIDNSSSIQSIGLEPNRMGDSELILTYSDGINPTINSRAYVEDDKLRIEKARDVNIIESVFMPSTRRDPNVDKAERLSKLLKTQRTDQIIRTLKVLEEKLENISILYVAGDPIIHAAIKGQRQLIPLALMGDGIGRLLSIALAITYASGGAVFIDEIENGLHYSVMADVGKAIASLAHECNVQVFTTSHSEECIFAMREGIVKTSTQEKSGRLFRLERKNDQIIAVSFTLEELEVAEDHQIEVR